MLQQLHITEDLRTEKEYWHSLVDDILKQAKKKGATAAEVAIGRHLGFNVNVRMGAVDTIEHNRDKTVDVAVYFGDQKGSASTNDLSAEAISGTIEYACNIARLTTGDPFSGLADPQLICKNILDLDLYYPWSITPDHAIEMALDCEASARNIDKRVVSSEGVGISNQQGISIYGNTHGFIGSLISTKHSLGCVLVSQDGNGMQRDGYYTNARDPQDLNSAIHVAKESVSRVVDRLGGKRIKTCVAPVIFHAEVAKGLIGHFLSAIMGGNIYRKSSFLLDQVGEQVFPKHINIFERPFLPKGWASSSFDAEGVATKDRDIIKDGVLQSYMLGSYSARKLGLQSTGNAGGAHNILLSTSDMDLAGLMKHMDKGLLVTELLGQGVSIVTGDYSRGVAGFWIENGVIQFPVEEITIAGNLRDMFANLIAVGNDVDTRSAIYSGSILLDKMTIAGE